MIQEAMVSSALWSIPYPPSPPKANRWNMDFYSAAPI